MNKKNVLNRIVSFCLAMSIAVACLGFVGCSDAAVSNDISKQDALSVSIEDVETYSEGMVDAGEKLLGGEPAYLVKKLTATVNTSSHDAAHKAVDWSVSWLDDTCTLNVSDFITVHTESDGSNEAYIRCHGNFMGTIVVTCTTRVGGHKATCLVNYVGIPTEMTVSLNESCNASLVEHDKEDGVYYYELTEDSSVTFDIYLRNIFGLPSDAFVPEYDVTVSVVNKFALEEFAMCSNPEETYIDTITWVTPYWDAKNRTICVEPEYDFYHNLNNSFSNVMASIDISGNSLEVFSYYAPENMSYRFEGRPWLEYFKFYRYGNDSGCMYYAVTVTEKTTGLSASFNFRIVAPVVGVDIDNTEVIF